MYVNLYRRCQSILVRCRLFVYTRHTNFHCLYGKLIKVEKNKTHTFERHRVYHLRHLNLSEQEEKLMRDMMR